MPLDRWDDPKTAHYFEAFCLRHTRYREANRRLVDHARLRGALKVLDLGAGTGRTTEVALRHLGKNAKVLCVEPAAAMRSAGSARIRDPRVEWSDSCPPAGIRFERILCGAAIWQMLPIRDTFVRLARLLTSGGLLCFNIPSLYLGIPDAPGGGSDPFLLELPALLRAEDEVELAPPLQEPLAPEFLENALRSSGLVPERWSFRVKWTQASYRDWLKIPPMTEYLLPKLDPDERATRIDEAYARTDPLSWRWENWTGWTATKRES